MCVRTYICVCVSRLKYEAAEREVCEVNQGVLLLQGGGQAVGLRGFQQHVPVRVIQPQN